MKQMKNHNFYDNCMLCPRTCGAQRSKGKTGICGVTETLKVARAALHFWEEPCISGTKGSGAVFFSGCALHCVFCQNESIAQGTAGKEITPERLVEIFLELQEQGANNINLVTPGQYVPHIIRAVEQARRQGLAVPIVYNTGSYENVDTIKALEGIVDIYLPDFKYMDPFLAAKYSHAPDYPQTAKSCNFSLSPCRTRGYGKTGSCRCGVFRTRSGWNTVPVPFPNLELSIWSVP